MFPERHLHPGRLAMGDDQIDRTLPYRMGKHDEAHDVDRIRFGVGCVAPERDLRPGSWLSGMTARLFRFLRPRGEKRFDPLNVNWRDHLEGPTSIPDDGVDRH